MLYQALAPALAPLVALVPPLLGNASGGSKEAASAARALLRLQVSVVDCLGQEASVVLVIMIIVFFQFVFLVL